jgi:hypothetical protein
LDELDELDGSTAGKEMDRFSQRAMNGAALAPLNNRQKAVICILARKAFDRLAESGAIGDAAEPENWRREQQKMAVGKIHLTECRNADYLALKARFQDLAGNPVAALRNHLRAATEPRSWALAKLRKECAAAADVLPGAWNYAAGFLRNKRGVAIEDCPDRDLWHAVFMIRRRAAQLRRKRKMTTERTERTEGTEN